MRRTFLGSISDYVVHHAHLPVCVVPPYDSQYDIPKEEKTQSKDARRTPSPLPEKPKEQVKPEQKSEPEPAEPQPEAELEPEAQPQEEQEEQETPPTTAT